MNSAGKLTADKQIKINGIRNFCLNTNGGTKF